MPTTYPRDRFDDVPRQPERVGAHRAERRRTPVGIVLLWAALAAAVLTAAGIVGFLVLSQRVDVEPAPGQTEASTEGVVDPTYDVWVLNGTATSGLAEEVVAEIVGAGWAEDKVVASSSSTTDFPETTVYYAAPEHEAAAQGLASVLGDALIQESDRYATDDPAAKELTVVIGLDRVSAG